MKEFVMKRKDNYWWERSLVIFGKPFIMFLVDTPITPNMVTIVNLFIVVPLIIFASHNRMYYLIAFLVQLYMFLDVVDGNLARNKDMKSELGRRLDIFSDTFFYIVGFFFIGKSMDLPLCKIIIFIVIQQLYGNIATYYIVPKINKLYKFEHTHLKNYFLKYNILFGMDASLETLITSVLLLVPIRKHIFVLCPILWIVDLIYRLYELNWINRNNLEVK